MESYKIRVSGRLDEEAKHNCDFSAVRHGQRLAVDGEKLEVYRRGECIFKSEDLGSGQYANGR